MCVPRRCDRSTIKGRGFTERHLTRVVGAHILWSLSLSGGFTPCRHLRPSSGWDHRVIYITYSIQWVEMSLPPGHDALLFSISGTRSCVCPVAQTRLDIPKPLITQSWTTGGGRVKFVSFQCQADSSRRPFGLQSTALTTRPWWPPPPPKINIPRILNSGIFTLMGRTSAI